MASYTALDGSTVTIPPVRPLPDGPAGPIDHIDITPLLETRASELARLGSPRDAAAMPEGMPGFMKPLLARQNKEIDRLRREAETLVDESLRRFGPDGAGFLEDFKAGKLDEDFWQAERILTASRRPITQYHAPKSQAVVRDLLATLPPARHIPILAQIIEPDPKHRKSDKLYELLDAYLASPAADLRHWETGHEAVNSLDDLPLEVLQALATAISVRIDALRSFSRMATSGIGALLTGGKVKDMMTRSTQKLSREEAIALMEGPPPAKGFEKGTVQSELNLHKLEGLGQVLDGRVRGRPKGRLLMEALMAWPPGDWKRFRFDLFEDAYVWPYLAENFPIFDRALGLAEPLPFEPAFQPLKALDLLKRLPKTPARYEEVLRDMARKSTPQGKAAKALLA